IESDGGTLRNSSWLNIVDANPGNPAALTGANFDTGIANIAPSVFYTIAYGAPIVNAVGPDLAIIAARFSSNDFVLSVSSGGVTFSAPQTFPAVSAIDTGVAKDYFFAGGGPFSAELFLYSVDLSSFGIAPGDAIDNIRITSDSEGDLIRVAGLS